MFLRLMRASVALAAVLALAASPVLAGPASAAVSGPRILGRSVWIDLMSCSSPGNCVAIGHRHAPNPKPAFIVTEKNWVWGTARAVPGLSALLASKPGGAEFVGLSCLSAGNCDAAGNYSPKVFQNHPFVIAEKHGTWGKAHQVRGIGTSVGTRTRIRALSCPSAGNCAAVGAMHGKLFAVSERNGTWGKAEPVGGKPIRGVNGPGFSQLTCPSAGNCLGVGSYSDRKGDYGPFVVAEKHGKWGKVRTFPRIIALRTFHFAGITSAWCKSAGNCTAVGYYYWDNYADTIFSLSQKNGTWGPIESLTGGGTIDFFTCLSLGNCTAGGILFDGAVPEMFHQPYVVTEKNGTWGGAHGIPGVADLSANSSIAGLGGVACPSAGNCSAVGSYDTVDQGGGTKIFVSTETGGVWGTATELPGLAPLGAGPLSCGAPGDCAMAGEYDIGSFVSKPFLATQRNGVWGEAEPVKGLGP
jgi:hypothetical protein